MTEMTEPATVKEAIASAMEAANAPRRQLRQRYAGLTAKARAGHAGAHSIPFLAWRRPCSAALETYCAQRNKVKGRNTVARLGNELYWAFSGVAGVLLLVAAVFIFYATPDNGVLIFACVRFVIPASITWLIGRGCHYFLGGDASALWERALIDHARRSPHFRKLYGTIALLIVSDIAFVVLDVHRQEAVRKQQYEQQRQAAVAAQQAAAQREAAAERAATISATDLSFGDVSVRPRLTGNDAFGRPFTQDQMDEFPILSGTITNHSGQTLRYLEFEVTLKDCSVAYGSDKCKVVGHENMKPTVDIPPTQTGAFSADVGFLQLPHRDPQHQRFFSWRIVTASSCSQEALSAHQCANKSKQRSAARSTASKRSGSAARRMPGSDEHRSEETTGERAITATMGSRSE
jgi:hypothetical protein